MNEYEHLIYELQNSPIDIRCARIMKEAANAITELSEKIKNYRHTVFMISETCVDESKWHITSEQAIEEIRKILIEADKNGV